MDEFIKEFSIADYFMFVIVLFISLGIGIYFASKKKDHMSREGFLMAGRNANLFPVMLSLFASFHSAIILMGLPVEHYTRGITHWIITFGHGISLITAAHIFIPVYFPLKLTSIYEYLELRFKSRAIRRLGAFVMIIDMIFYMSIVLYAPSMAFSSVTNIPLWILLVVVGIICSIYTTVGGMKAVLWTDVFQVLIMFIGILAVIIQGCINVGSMSEIWQRNLKGRRLDFALDPNPFMYHNVWCILIGGSIKWLATYGTHQTQIQRYACLGSISKAQTALYYASLLVVLMTGLTTFAGLVLYANYAYCDPLKTGVIQKKDQLMPYFVMESFGSMPGLPGLFLAALFSGSMSTMSSGLNSMAAVTWEDYLKFNFSKLSEIKSVYVTKGLVAVYGCLTIALAFVTANVSGLVQAYNSFSGAFGGPILGLFLMALFVPCVNVKGLFCGIFGSFIFSTWITIGQWISHPYKKLLPSLDDGCITNASVNYSNANNNNMPVGFNNSYFTHDINDYFYPSYDSGLTYLYSLSFWWFATLGVLVTLTIAIFVSFLTGMPKLEDVNIKLLSPWVRHLYCCRKENEWQRIKKIQKEIALQQEEISLSFLDSPNIIRHSVDFN